MKRRLAGNRTRMYKFIDRIRTISFIVLTAIRLPIALLAVLSVLLRTLGSASSDCEATVMHATAQVAMDSAPLAHSDGVVTVQDGHEPAGVAGRDTAAARHDCDAEHNPQHAPARHPGHAPGTCTMAAPCSMTAPPPASVRLGLTDGAAGARHVTHDVMPRGVALEPAFPPPRA